MLDRKRRQEKVRSPTFLLMEREFVSTDQQDNHQIEETNYMEVLDRKRLEEKVLCKRLFDATDDKRENNEIQDEKRCVQLQVLEYENAPKLADKKSPILLAHTKQYFLNQAEKYTTTTTTAISSVNIHKLNENVDAPGMIFLWENKIRK